MATKAAPPVPPDEAPDQTPQPDPVPVEDPDEGEEMHWHDNFRSMLDHPRHALHHLKDA